MNADEMKGAWRSTANGLNNGNATQQVSEEFRNGNPVTTLDRLRRRYRLMAIAALLMMLPGWNIMRDPEIPFGGHLWFAITFAAYFLIAAVMNLILCHMVGKIDCAAMTVSQVVNYAKKCRKMHLTLMVPMMIMAIVILANMFALAGIGDGWMFGAMLTGLIVGIILGVMIFHRYMSDYRSLF